MSKKIGRNQKCICGSGLKYKKCCLRRELDIKATDTVTVKYGYEKMMKSKDLLMKMKDDLLYRSDVKIQSHLGNEVDKISSFKDLPSEINEEVETLLRNVPFKSAHCFHNSYLIASKIDGVEKVDGIVGWKFDCGGKGYAKESELIQYDLDTETYVVNPKGLDVDKVKIQKVSKGVIKVNMMEMYKDIEGTSEIMGDVWEIWDYNSKYRFMKNSWNVYKGIHFDITAELDEERTKHFSKYVENEIRVEPYKDGSEEKEIMDCYLDYILRSQNGITVLNDTYIGNLTSASLNVHPKYFWKMDINTWNNYYGGI